MDKLAIFGGTPVRDTKIYYGRQFIDDDDIAAMAAVLKSRFITTGPQVRRAEEKLCGITGAAYAVVLSSGTAALHIACLALDIAPGDEVIVPPMTFAATANAVLYCGATPVFADIDPLTYNIDPAEVEKKITEKTRAVIAVDFTGQAAELDRLKAICAARGLVLIEDAAHAIGTVYGGRAVGGIADITCFSFHPVKTVTAGEGGAVTTNSPELYERLERLRTHGIVRDPAKMEREPHGRWYQEQAELGYNYRMTDFQAALLCSQLDKLDRFSARRKEIARRYNEAFGDVPELSLQKNLPASDTTPHLYILRLNRPPLGCTRREFFDAIDRENVVCQVHYMPVYYHPYYQRLGYPKGLCPIAESLYEDIISIPLYYALSDYDVQTVIDAVKKITAYYTA